MQPRDLIILFKSPVAREEFYSLPLYLLTFTECKCVRIEIINGICQFCVCISVGHVTLCFWRFVTHTDKSQTFSRKIRKLVLRGKIS